MLKTETKVNPEPGAEGDGKTTLVLPGSSNSSTSLGNINWSNAGHTIAYNRMVDLQGVAFYQLFTLELSTLLN